MASFNQQIISLFPQRHEHDGALRPLIRSAVRLGRLRRGTHPALFTSCPGCGSKIRATGSAERDWLHPTGWCVECGGIAKVVS
jgi:hypothetical protein